MKLVPPVKHSKLLYILLKAKTLCACVCVCVYEVRKEGRCVQFERMRNIRPGPGLKFSVLEVG